MASHQLVALQILKNHKSQLHSPIIDISNPAACARAGGCETAGYANGVAVAGNFAFVADSYAGLQVIDVSNPANCARAGGCETSGSAHGVTVSGNRIYVADGQKGLLVLYSLSNIQHMMQVDGGTLGTPFTIESAESLNEPIQWTSMFTTNPPVLPFEFIDFDVKLSEKPLKFYRVRQP